MTRVTDTAGDPLLALNLEMMEQESAGNRDYFDALLAPEFAMRRGDLRTVVGRDAFLCGVSESARRDTEDLEVVLSTDTLAVIRSTVAMMKDGAERRVVNVRGFVRSSVDDPWQLLAWINEPPT